MSPRARRSILSVLLLAAALPCAGAEVQVAVTGLESAQGALGCSLFGEAIAERFPLDPRQARTQRAPARPGRQTCVFRELRAGTYAVAVAHDVNDNGRTDRNLVGLPTEPWAVSNNVKPILRAPRFEEAAFAVTADEVRQIELHLSR